MYRIGLLKCLPGVFELMFNLRNPLDFTHLTLKARAKWGWEDGRGHLRARGKERGPRRAVKRQAAFEEEE